jgi:hypothetical protein
MSPTCEQPNPSGHFIKAAVSWVISNAAVIASFAICFVYRAVNEQDIRTIAEGRGIIAKSAEGTWSVGEHVGLGSSRAAWANDPWIATTHNLDVARAFERNGIVAIDLTRVPSQQVEAWRLYPRTNPAYHYSIWQEEVSVRAFIPQDAIVGWVG